VAPSIVWGIGVGLLIAAIDAVALVLSGTVSPSDWPINEIDSLLNIALYSLIGFKVGRATGIVRDAAEAGVLASVLVAAIGLGVAQIFTPPEGPIDAPIEIVRLFAQNIAMGGILAIVAGWFGSRAARNSAGGRP
jgi:hypothetical protein